VVLFTSSCRKNERGGHPEGVWEAGGVRKGGVGEGAVPGRLGWRIWAPLIKTSVNSIGAYLNKFVESVWANSVISAVLV